jgi:fermentation-respiration switch protein FrsA (DUF1100 family)
MIHALRDPLVPYAQGRRLYDLSPRPKELWTLDGGGHCQAFDARAAEYRPKLLVWLDEVLKRPVGSGP